MALVLWVTLQISMEIAAQLELGGFLPVFGPNLMAFWIPSSEPPPGTHACGREQPRWFPNAYGEFDQGVLLPLGVAGEGGCTTNALVRG